jgi:hypothetical protein
MDYNRNECQAVVENSQDNLFNLRPSTGIAFFEAICLRGKFNQCILNLRSNTSIAFLEAVCLRGKYM